MESNYAVDELLQEAVDGGYVEEGSAAHGIAKQSNDRGRDSLSPIQKAIYRGKVLPHLKSLQAKKDVAERMRGMPD